MYPVLFPSSAAPVLVAALIPLTAVAGQRAYGPTGFVPNMGQFIDQEGTSNVLVDFLFQGEGLNVQLRRGGFSYDTWHNTEVWNERSDEVRLHRIDIRLEGSEPAARWEGFDPSTDVLNYYTAGTGEEGVTGVHHYQRVRCRNIYPFIDLEFRTSDDEGGIKYDFIVHPGGDPGMIRLRYAGARSALDVKANSVALSWDEGTLQDRVPESYWEFAGKRDQALVSVVQLEADLFTYELKSEHAGGVLVIDPVPALQWGTYYGNGDHRGSLNAVAFDPAGNTIAVGTAGLAGLASTGAYDQVLSGTTDALMVKLNSSGQRVWATYYGGGDLEFGNAVGVDANGLIYFAGDTYSTGNIATLGAHQTQLAGASDAFLAKFNTNGTRVWSTYYGGTGDDRAHALAVDGSGEPAIAGSTTSSAGIAATGAADGSYGGSTDAFLAKFYATGVREWATYLGGSGSDDAKGLGCDNTYFFLCGSTASTTGIALGNTHQTALNTTGPTIRDAYVVKYSGLGQKMWGSYFGGNGADYGNSCFAELLTGDVYIAGRTASTNAIASFGAHQISNGGGNDGFLAKFNYVGVRQWSTYLGGADEDVMNGVSVGAYSRVYVTGVSDSPTRIATTDATYPTIAGGSDAFINSFSSGGSRLWGTYYGGSGYDGAFTLDVDGLEVAIAGITGSTTNIATPGTFQTTASVSSGNYAKYVATFTAPLFLMMNGQNPTTEQEVMRVNSGADGIRLHLPVGIRDAGDELVTIHVLDAMGRVVLSQKVSTEVSTKWIPWQDVASGVYSVVLETRDEHWTARVLKE